MPQNPSELLVVIIIFLPNGVVGDFKKFKKLFIKVRR